MAEGVKDERAEEKERCCEEVKNRERKEKETGRTQQVSSSMYVGKHEL